MSNEAGGKFRMFVFASPSGGGKSTIIRRILQARPQLKFSISACTRPRKPGEVDGVDYLFLSRSQFDEMIEKGEFIEFEEVHGELYGTPKSQITQAEAEGWSVIFDLDVKGALKLKSLYPSAVLIFIDVPSIEVLRRRLLNRGRENEAEIEKRITRFRMEMESADKFDFRIVNDNLEKAVSEILRIIDSKINE
ncbi:guanylate kinase [bacterium]|nr:guanylate kinase [FCB group bacterium]MBL7190416.1 guanylate kinase [bacterium]